jgi:hypothetical protein
MPRPTEPKRCPGCGVVKSPEEYGTQSRCKACHKAYIKARYVPRPRMRPTLEEIKANARARSLRWYHANAEILRRDRLADKTISLGFRSCVECGDPIAPVVRSDAVFCTHDCMMRFHRRKWIDENPDKHKAAQRAWEKRNPDAQRAGWARRRARKHDAFVEDVDRLVVLDGACGICGHDVDPLDFHVDHIVPLARGGEHSYANTQAAHPLCNHRKNVRLVEAA